MVLLKKFLIFVLFAPLVASCSSDALQDKSDLRTGDQENAPSDEPDPENNIKDDDSGSDVPADVTALFLSLDCKSIAASENQGRYELLCRVADKLGKFLIPTDFASSHNWQVAGSGLLASNVSIIEIEDDQGYGAKITIGKDQYVKTSVLSELNVKLDYVDKVNNKPGSISKRLDTIYAGLVNQKYMRFAIFSVKDHLTTEPIQFLDKISLRVDGQWLDLTVNETTGELSLGSIAVGSNGTLTDAALFMNILGKNNPVLPATFMSRFNGNPEFDASEPLYLNFGNGKPISITGLRYNDGMPITNSNIAAGFPDDFQFETSPDNVNWTPIKDSRIKVDSINDQDIFEYVLNGSEAN